MTAIKQSLLHVSLLVHSYDDAIDFYVNRLGFSLVEDTHLEEGKRWVVVKPPGDAAASLVLARAVTDAEKERVGDQAGGRVFLFLYTDDFKRDYDRMRQQQVEFVRPSETHDYGTVAVFSDLYGNLWDLLEPGPNHALYSHLR